MSDLLHGISAGNTPEELNVIIENSPATGKAKYEVDKETGLLMLDRVLRAPMTYPTNYGYVPQTLCEDGDPLDVFVVCQADLLPLSLVESRVVGVIKMIDGGETDDKIIAVAKNDAYYDHVKDILDLPKIQIEEMMKFFRDYKELEKKEVDVTGMHGREEAIQIVKESIELYENKK